MDTKNSAFPKAIVALVGVVVAVLALGLPDESRGCGGGIDADDIATLEQGATGTNATASASAPPMPPCTFGDTGQIATRTDNATCSCAAAGGAWQKNGTVWLCCKKGQSAQACYDMYYPPKPPQPPPPPSGSSTPACCGCCNTDGTKSGNEVCQAAGNVAGCTALISAGCGWGCPSGCSGKGGC